MIHAETGCYPLIIAIKSRTLNFIKHIEKQCPTQLSYMAYTYQKQIFETKSDLQRPNIHKYFLSIKQEILENTPKFDNCDVSHTTVPNENFNIFNRSKTFLCKCLKQGYHKRWKSMLNQTSKSLCYCKHKLNIKLEPYLLQVRNIKHRRMLAKLRLSDPKLEIETGRHHRPKVDQDKRICRLCNTSEVENKIHFLMQCNLYKQFTRLRKDFHSSINFIDKQSAEQS